MTLDRLLMKDRLDVENIIIMVSVVFQMSGLDLIFPIANNMLL